DQMSLGTKIITSSVWIHFGRFTDDKWVSIPIKILWVLIGLAPGVLFISGFIMWWNRAVSIRLRGDLKRVRE
ncbi:MAG: PepSY domain-containing protein, partial [Pyrinomonadaceae bacterium]